jgi:hypothetical protein
LMRPPSTLALIGTGIFVLVLCREISEIVFRRTVLSCSFPKVA